MVLLNRNIIDINMANESPSPVPLLEDLSPKERHDLREGMRETLRPHMVQNARIYEGTELDELAEALILKPETLASLVETKYPELAPMIKDLHGGNEPTPK